MVVVTPSMNENAESIPKNSKMKYRQKLHQFEPETWFKASGRVTKVKAWDESSSVYNLGMSKASSSAPSKPQTANPDKKEVKVSVEATATAFPTTG
jgi:hypothetical protein